MFNSFIFRLMGLLLALSLLGLSAGCGQKGPLYLPDEAPEQDKQSKQKK